VFIYCLIDFLFNNTLFAQYPGMGAFRAQQTMNMANQQMQMQMQMQLSRNWLKSAGSGDDYEVTFKDSSKKKITSFMYTDTVLHKNFIVLVDKKFAKSDSLHRNRKIYPGETLSITYLSGFNGESNLNGAPVDSCWRFRVITGQLTVYGKYPDGYEEEFPASAIIAIQLKNAPEVTYSETTLGQLIANDPKAVQQFNKKKYYKAIMKFNYDAEK